MEQQGAAAADPENVAGDIPQPGDVVAGKFVVERALGVGGMGIVVAARHAHLGQTVAIKFLRRQAAKDPGAVSRFLREARDVAALQSDHVVRVMDAGMLDDGLPFIVMEHLHGTDLGEVLERRGSLPFDEVVWYLLQAMEGIAEAHERGIVHRDVKPSNLFMTVRPDGTPCVKVLDFGISKALDSGPQEMNLTATTMTLGSPLYMSPEQVRSSKTVDLRTDIWALGVVAYELLTGQQPFCADSITGVCAKIAADDPSSLRSVRPDIPAAFEDVVLRCLTKDPARRFQTVADLAAALFPFASGPGRESIARIARTAARSRPTISPIRVGDSSDAIGATLPSVAPQSPQPPKMDHPSLPASVAENLAPWPSSTPREPQRRYKATAAAFVVLAGGAALAWLSFRSSHGRLRTEGSVGIVSAGAVVAPPSDVPPQGTVVSLAPEPSARSEPPPPGTSTATAMAPTASAPAEPPKPVVRASSPGPTVDTAPANHRPARPPPAAKPPTPAATPHVLTQDELMLDRK